MHMIIIVLLGGGDKGICIKMIGRTPVIEFRRPDGVLERSLMPDNGSEVWKFMSKVCYFYVPDTLPVLFLSLFMQLFEQCV